MNDVTTVLVTGGAGFVGTRVCRALAATPGYGFRALDFPGPRLDALADAGGTCSADLLEPGRLEEALAGCDAVLHLVVAHEHASREMHERVTIGGARRVVEAAGNAGVRRLLFMSSIKAARDYSGLYGTSKKRAEAIVRTSGLDWTIFRPGLLYGPGELRLSAIARTLRKWWPVFPLPGKGDYPIYPLRTADLAGAIVAALGNPAAVGRVYELGSDRAVPLIDLVRMIAERIGKRKPVLRLPFPLCRWIGWALERTSRQPVLFVEQIRAMEVDFAPPDTGPAKRDLGFETPPFAEGLDELVRTWGRPAAGGGRRGGAPSP